MGGDDLASDDEYLNVKLVGSTGYVEESDNDEDEKSLTPQSETKEIPPSSGRKSKKRKASSQGVNLDKPIHKVKLLLETGRNIENQDTDIQSAFLWSCYVHFLRDKTDENLVNKNSIFDPSCFLLSSPQSTPIPPKISPMGYFIKNNVSSLKQLKKWKTPKSPVVLIVCLSARRATAVLKSLSSLNIRTAKLFSKHFDLNQQITMLRDNSYGIGVGTPNRMLKLFTSSEESPALSLKHTELFILDSHADNKRFTVCTLNDTGPDLMEFMKLAVQPQLQRKKKPIKLAFV